MATTKSGTISEQSVSAVTETGSERISQLLSIVNQTTIYTLCFKKNAPTLADYNYDPVQSI